MKNIHHLQTHLGPNDIQRQSTYNHLKQKEAANPQIKEAETRE